MPSDAATINSQEPHADGSPRLVAPVADGADQELASLVTSLDVAEIRQRLADANRRGRLAEIHWAGDSRSFHLTIPSRPILSKLIGQIADGTEPGSSSGSASGGARSVTFQVVLHRRLLWLYILLTVLLTAIGTPLTDYFWPWARVWYWYPPMSALSVLWMWWRWPACSLRDAQRLVDGRIETIRSRLDGS